MKFKTLKTAFFLSAGAIVYSIGLRFFLIPNHMIDGGITGISIILNYVFGTPLGLLFILFNIPFLILGYKFISNIYAFATMYSILILSIIVELLPKLHPFTDEPILAAVFGGITIGIGIGIIIRYGGSLDGTETVGIIFDKKTGFSVGEIVLFINLFIMAAAGIVFGWEKAMYSLITYFVAFKVIDVTIEGFNESKSVMIVSSDPNGISKVIMNEMGKGVTLLEAVGGFSGEPKKIVYTVITRFEIAKIKSIVNQVDKNAFITISDIREVMGGRVRKRK